MRRQRRKHLIMWTALLAAVFAAGAYAYTNTITMTAPPLGSGSQAINGYTAGTITYNLNAANPLNLDSVSFPLTGATAAVTTVQIQLAAAGTWYSCVVAAGAPPVVTCATTAPQATAAAAMNLTIVANK